MTLQTPIENIAGIGPAMAERLEKLGITTVADLFEHFPFRYEDYVAVKKISNLVADEPVTIIADVWEITNVYTRFHKVITRALVNDSSGSLEIIWFNQPFLTKNLKAGLTVQFSGKVKQDRRKLQLTSPAYEIVGETKQTINTGRLVPVYPETFGVTSRWLRGKIALLAPTVLPLISDWLPTKILEKHDLIGLPAAINSIHFPDSKGDVRVARRRLAFDELVTIHLASLERKYEWQSKSQTTALAIDNIKINAFIKSLPFLLTNAQQRVIDEILADLSRPKAMNRLLEGDVGSGKTVVAAVGIFTTYQNGLQSAVMAPTEILAKQHYETLKQFLEPHGLSVALVTGGKKAKRAVTRPQVEASPTAGNPSTPRDDKESRDDQQANVLVGTHALLSESIQFANLGFVVIDEQHKFGVEQRALLREKGNTPHVLTMTATPIPRTLALTLYGNLDLSVIDEMPPGRAQVKTYVVPNKKREDAYKFIEKEIAQKSVQAFIVCPLIDESETYATAKAANVEYERLRTDVFPNLRVGLLHGRMKSKEKDATMEQFRVGGLDILVATPLVEVGVDIPKATIMLIEAADRFGLAQLHQLRGRVGRRSDQDAYCLLFTELYGRTSLARLKAMETIYSGLKLAEIDLQYRGAGELFGTMQHGIPNFKVAKLTNAEMIAETKVAAQEIFDKFYAKDPAIRSQVKKFNQKLTAPN